LAAPGDAEGQLAALDAAAVSASSRAPIAVR